MATKIATDGKSRLSVCNTLDKILVHSGWPDAASRVRQLLANAFQDLGIEVIGDVEACTFDASISPVESEAVWHEEFLGGQGRYRLSGRCSEAIRKNKQILRRHSAAIVTANAKAAGAVSGQC